MGKLLVIGNIWPEPSSSAASARLRQIVHAYGAAGWQVTYVSDARENDATAALRALGVTCARLAPNDPAFDEYVAALQPDVALFDRYTMEEKFGWRVRATCPHTVRVLDTIDLHFLRLGRDRHPTDNTIAHREVAAIYRSDLTLLTSDHEQQVLTEQCQVPKTLLHVCRLAYPDRTDAAGYGQRKGFAMFGNYRHPPNADAVAWVKKDIWPRIRAKLPDAQIDIWGAYPAPEHLALHAPSDGFNLRGFNEAHWQDLQAHRVNLAPLRAGAGIKGKIADGWWSGMPVVATSIGAEGMHAGLPFGGIVADTAEAIADAAVTLHDDSMLWAQSAARGQRIIDQLYSAAATTAALVTRIEELRLALDDVRRLNFTGSMIWQQGLRATEFFSRWIELKERGINK